MEYAYNCAGACIGYIEDRFHVFSRTGDFLGSFAVRPGARSEMPSQEIYGPDGTYLAERRQGRFLIDAGKRGTRANGLIPLRPQLPPLPPRLWPGKEEPHELPAGCADIVP